MRDTGELLIKEGYDVKVLDLINMEKSHCYNPFVYIRNDNDVQRLVTNLFKSTTPKGAQAQDPFWDTAASMLLLAMIFYLVYEAPKYEQNFPMVMEMLRAGGIDEDNSSSISPLDCLFDDLEYQKPGHIAVKYYRDYRTGSAKTLKSIQITLAARLEKFNLEPLAAMTMTDELELNTLGEKKSAIFALIPDNDTSFNFLVSILYTQLFQQLFYVADHKYGGSLPVPVHFCMDEFANVSLPDDFDKILAVMRSRGVSVSIILQNMAQLKALFEKQWESIVGNCDEFLYLGGNEQSTHKYVSELLGKETIDMNTYGKSTGRSGNYSTNYQLSGRELLTPDEVRLLDNRYALLFIRGERPVKDFKYDILKHPNVKFTTDGEGKPYEHGKVTEATGNLEFEYLGEVETNEKFDGESTIEILTEKELEERYEKEDAENEKRSMKKIENRIPGKVKIKTLSKCACALSLALLVVMIPQFAFAATSNATNQDPLTVVTNLQNFIFSLIRAIGMILLGLGVMQVGLSLKSHDPSQRANGFLTVAGGIIITFTKEILTLITG